MNTSTAQIISLMFFLFLATSLFSQNKELDSLEIELQNHTQKDSLRVYLLNEIAYLCYEKDLDKTISYITASESISDSIDFKKGKARSLYIKGITQAVQSNFDKGFQFFNESLQLYKGINFEPGIPKCYHAIGKLHYQKGNLKDAITNYLKSVSGYETLGNKEGISAGLNSIGIAYSDIGDYTVAVDYLKKALQISKKINNEGRISRCLSNIGSIYSDQGNYALALEYENKALAIDEKRKDTLGISKSLNNIGVIHKNLKNYDKSIISYKKALEIHQRNGNKKNALETLNNLGLVYKRKKNYGQAHRFLREALSIGKEIQNEYYIGIIINNIGDVCLESNDNSTALEYFEKARKINLEVNSQRALCNSYLGLAKVNTNQKKYDKALIQALKSKELSTKLGLMNYQRDVSELLSKIYRNTGDYEMALASHQEFKALNDSLFNKENIEKIAQLEYDYKYKQALDSASIRELLLTKAVTATNLDLEKSQRNYLWAIIGVLLVSIFLGSIIFYQKYKNIKTKNENIVMEQKLLRSQMTPHFIFNSLSVLQGMILNKEDKKSVSYLSKFSKLLRITLENSRDKTVLLSEEIAAVDNYLNLRNLENEDYLHHIRIDDSIDTASIKIPPMLIQPFIENAVEHAFADNRENRKIEIHLKRIDEKLVCNITDNGVGIDVQKERNRKDKKSLATTITSERLEILAKDLKMKGSISVEDRKKYGKHGTLVTLVIPYVKVA